MTGLDVEFFEAVILILIFFILSFNDLKDYIKVTTAVFGYF